MSEIKVVINDITRLSAKIAELEAEITQLNAQITDLETQIQNKDVVIETLTRSISELESEISTLQGQVVELSAQVDTLTTQNQFLTQQIQTLNEQISSLTTQITNLNTQITNMNSAIETINGETVANPIAYLSETKSQILTALQNKGSSATSSTTFRNYATEIENLPSGTPTSDTLALFHFDNDSGLTDSSDYKLTLSTLTGTPQIDPSTGKFSNGSLYLDGSSALYINTTQLNPFSHPEWTVEFWIQGDANGEQWQTVISQHKYYTPTGGSEIQAWFRINFDATSTRKLNFEYPNMDTTTAATLGSSTANYSFYSLGQWHHVALCKNSLDSSYMFRYYLDGVFKSWTSNVPGIYTRGFLPLAQFSTNVYIGTRYYSAGNPPYTQYFKGWLNDIRFSKVCRYTNDFTPPTQPFNS